MFLLLATKSTGSTVPFFKFLHHIHEVGKKRPSYFTDEDSEAGRGGDMPKITQLIRGRVRTGTLRWGRWLGAMEV